MRVEAHSALLAELQRRAQAAGMYLVARIQDLRGRAIQFSQGRLEESARTFSAGVGLQVFTVSGHHAFAAVDGFEPERVFQALARAIAAAQAAERADLEANQAIFDLSPVRDQVSPPLSYAFDGVGQAELEQALGEIHQEIQGYGTGLSVRSGLVAASEEWRISRSDGTDVAFHLPRCSSVHPFTYAGSTQTHAVAAALSGASYDVVLDNGKRAQLLKRCHSAASKALGLPQALEAPAGSFDLVIDYALAKGLAHEAVGHAAESDAYQSSILASGGKWRSGETLASELVSIIDEPRLGDYAYQPYSANGVRRERAVILDHGVLRDALADVFTAGRIGVRVTGAERAQSYSDVPLPRMSNIRIELAEAVPINKPIEEISPEEVRDLLEQEGLLKRPVYYLSGYKGGQVNPKLGEFVFNCAAIYELTPSQVRLMRPAIFSGQITQALQAIKKGFGPLQLDAQGTCGKQGQSVPSSGGSHYFLFLERHPGVYLGGAR
ncbi:MAG: TldD/PmbA family protein [Deinococcus sp.]|nr:TldD/PmbA family protein [Deinococcus sp.]